MKVLSAMLLCVALPVGAQSSSRAAHSAATASSAVLGVRELWGISSRYLVAAAEQMPDFAYAFKPTPDVRSFGQLVGHVAHAQQLLCGMALGQKPVESSPTSKEELLAALRSSNGLCARAYDIADAAAGEKTRSDARLIAPRDGQHDFDFEIGTWKTHLKRRLRPLTGSNTWVEYDGVTMVRKVWGGRANLVELTADGTAGHFQAASLRLYSPASRQWSLNFANASDGQLTQPSIGEFRDGRGEFYNQELLNGRAILVRFVISDITPTSCHFEQSYSDDGGKTWELNWVADDTRVPD